MRSMITVIFLPSLTCRDYTIAEKINLWRGKARAGVHPLWNTILATDLASQVPELDIPAYFFHGIYDYTVSYNLAKDYFNKIKAPVKGFYTFNQSAHSPMFEEPDRVKEILLTDILTGSNSLAEKKQPSIYETTMIRRLADHKTSNILIFMGVTSKCVSILSNTEKQTLVMR